MWRSAFVPPNGRKNRKPVIEHLKRQGRFAHFIDENVAQFQSESASPTGVMGGGPGRPAEL